MTKGALLWGLLLFAASATQANTICVSTPAELFKALHQATLSNSATTILLTPGEYHLQKTINITMPYLTIASASGRPADTILRGIGMKPTKSVNNLIRVAADHFTLRGLTLREAPNHLVQVAGELGTSYPIFDRIIFEDSYEQMLKVSYGVDSANKTGSIGGLVNNSIFQYTAGVAPNYYTGGIDAIGAKKWVVTDSLFRNIASPAKRISQHAVHFWTNAADNIVTNNVFINNDRAIGFGMINGAHQKNSVSHRGGAITNNMIYHEKNDAPYADVSIILEASDGANVANNWIFMEHDYQNAIEYRFDETVNNIISDNMSNRQIKARNGGEAKLINNNEALEKPEFSKRLYTRINEIVNRVNNSNQRASAICE